MNVELIEGFLLIRTYRPEDIDSVFEAASESSPQLSPWLGWCHPDLKREEIAGYVLSREAAWQNKEEFGFGLFERTSGKFLGGIGLNQFNHPHRIGNLGYWVRTSCTGRGIASTAARRVAQYGFAELGLERIEIVVAVANTASQRVAEKVGAMRECVQRKRLFINDQSQDAVVFSLIKDSMIA